MSKLQIITINNIQYYNAKDVYELNAAFFYGCANNTRNIVKKKKLADKDYLYAYMKDNKWVISNQSYFKAALLLTKSWVDNNVKGADETKNIANDIEMAPPAITLNDDEYFVDENGTKMEIDIRGYREKEEFYFNVDDVSKTFKISQLNKTINDSRNNGYKKDVHYKYFFFTKGGPAASQENKIKFLYFTHRGLLRCLYVSKSNSVEKFQDWSTRILFTHQFGSVEKKTALATKLLGVSSEAAKQVLRTSITPIPCIYLFTLGTAKDLRTSMKIDPKYNDNMVICKYGKTDNLERRTGEHISTYGSIKGSNMALKYYSYIDPIYITEAENDIKEFFNNSGAHLKYDNHVELIIVEPKVLNEKINKQFVSISKVYSGCVANIQTKIENLENKLLIEKEKNEKLILERNLIILEKEKRISELEKEKRISELEKEKRISELEKALENEVLKKELEILKMKCNK